LAAWVLAAERLGQGFALRLPGLDLPPASGEAQRRAALEALALWQPAGAVAASAAQAGSRSAPASPVSPLSPTTRHG
jgi:uncharacterized protein (DUF58 family)